MQKPSIHDEVKNDAKNFIKDHMLKEMVEHVLEYTYDEISDDIYNDYDNGDGNFHIAITDRYYDRNEAIEILDELYEHEEIDDGLWRGQEWEQMLATKAAYTYSNAVYSEINKIIEEMNNTDWEETLETIEDDDKKKKLIEQTLKKIIEQW